MNLRALQFSLALGLATTASARAQPATLTLHLVPGFNAISTPVHFGNNTVGELFPIPPDRSILYKYDALAGSYVSNEYDPALAGWQINGGFGGSLRPGEGAWLYVPMSVDFPIAGERVLSPPSLRLRLPGFNFVGCPNTQPCAFNEVMGFAPAAGDQVFLFNQPLPAVPNQANLAQAASSQHQFGPNGWDLVPVFGVGHAGFVFLADAPRVTIQPSRLVVAAGATAEFNAVPLGGTPTAYRWRFEGALLALQTNATLLLPRVGLTNEGRYTVEATFGAGVVVTSLAARLVVTIAPAIVRPPVSLSVVEGRDAKFDVVAAGSKPLFYQWRREGVALTPFIRDQTNLFLSQVKAGDAGAFDVAVSNFAGMVFSPAARLNVLIPPRILVQPQSQEVRLGEDVTLFVLATGTQPFVYQWLLNGNPIPGANNPTLTLTNLQSTDSGSYRVIVANVAGAVDSTQAVVRVDTPDFPFSDNFGGRTVLGGTFGAVRGTNIGATLEPGEPRLFGKRGGRSVWTSYVAPGTGIVTFRTRGSTFDTLLGAFVGTAVGALNELASDEDRAGFLTSEIAFNVRENERPAIVIDGLAGAQGEFILSWQFEPTPDLLPVILTHPASSTVTEGSNATMNVQATGGAIAYQWFLNNQPFPNATQPSITVPNVQSDLVGEYFARLRLGNRLVDTRPADLEINSPDAGPLQAGARSYDKFMDLVDATGGTPGRLVPAAPPVLGYTGSQVFNNNAAGGQDGEPLHCGVIGGASRWFSYIAPANGRLFLNTDGSAFDTLLAVYRGCCDFEDLTMVACDNNGGTNGLTSSLSLPATNGFVYYIAVDGVNGARGTVKLNYRLLLPITLTNLAMTTNSLTFKLKATPSYPFTIQRTTNMVSWAPLMTTNTSTGNFTFTDTNLPPPKRFLYRSVQIP